MAQKVKDIRSLALAPSAGYRSKTVTVEEWGGVSVIIREPSAESWIRWQSIAKKDNDSDEESIPEKAKRTLRADVTLFIDVLLDTDMNHVFSVDDSERIEAIYGPVHSRLLRQALDLITDAGDVKAK